MSRVRTWTSQCARHQRIQAEIQLKTNLCFRLDCFPECFFKRNAVISSKCTTPVWETGSSYMMKINFSMSYRWNGLNLRQDDR